MEGAARAPPSRIPAGAPVPRVGPERIGDDMRSLWSGVEDEASVREMLRRALGILSRVRGGERVLVRTADEVSVARALRMAGATDSDMRRIRFSHERG